MKILSGQETLALIAGGLAERIRPRNDGATIETPARRSEPCHGGAPVRVYFADNSRLWPETKAVRQRERIEALCNKHGIDAVWPAEHCSFPEDFSLKAADVKTVLTKSALVTVPDMSAVIAEASPFRGPSLNPVIAFELGIAALLGLPIFAWTSANYARHPAPNGNGRWLAFASLAARLLRSTSRELILGRNYYWDVRGFRVENFGMIESAVIAGNFNSVSVSIEDAIERCARCFAERAAAQAAPAAGEIVH